MEIIVSIVTGTFNRITYLQQMVESVRFSVGRGIQYEIVVVDGGSTDGTLQWCKMQKDVKLLEHGKLLGAVKAFNDGARAAEGRYVILANDDILFVDESIQSAITFMEDNPSIGIGCFYQDRRGWDWHVEEMPAVRNGKQTSTFYGQVCIVPRWLGEKVGWWGNYLRTYGGDNELSCNVLELGYKVLPVPCACIHDSTPSDTLRDINNLHVKYSASGNHPDTQAWLDKWTRGKFVGPVIADTPQVENPLTRTFRVLYAPIYEKGHERQRYQKKGLRLALQKYSLVSEIDYVNGYPDYIFDVAKAFKPDLFLLQVHSVYEFTASKIQELRAEHPTAFFFNWNGDYHTEHLYDRHYIDMLKQFDLTGLVTTGVASIYNKEQVRWCYWQIGYEDSDAKPLRTTPSHDVVFMGNGYSEKRLYLCRVLREQLSSFGLYGYWSEDYRPDGETLYDFDAGARLYKNCKIAIGDSQWPQATGFVSNRLFQAMSAGAFMLHQEFDGMTQLLGLQDGIHLVTWKTVEDLLEKIEYYLRHDDERKRIAKVGCDFVRKNHSFDVRVKELLREILHA